MISDSRVFGISIQSSYTSSYRGFWNNVFSGGGETPLHGGAMTNTESQSKDPEVFVDPKDPEPGVDSDAARDHIPPANLGEKFAHEFLGHLWGEEITGHPAGTAENKRDSITSENAVRATHPTRGQKTAHHDLYKIKSNLDRAIGTGLNLLAVVLGLFHDAFSSRTADRRMGTANAVLHGPGALIPDTSARRISYTAAPDCLLAKPTVLVHHLASGKCNGHRYNRQHECSRVAVSVDYSAFVWAVVRHQQARDDVPEKAEKQSRSLSGPNIGPMTGKLNKITLALLATNFGLWVYFWIAFVQASQPYDPRPWGHSPVDVYCLWGHAIGLTRSACMYPFMGLIR